MSSGGFIYGQIESDANPRTIQLSRVCKLLLISRFHNQYGLGTSIELMFPGMTTYGNYAYAFGADGISVTVPSGNDYVYVYIAWY